MWRALSEPRRIALAAAILFASVFAVYASMLPSGVSIGDQAEAQTVPYILGIAHPTGFPAYTLAGWLFSHAVPFGTVAWRLNAFAAVCTALGAAGVFLLAIAIGSELVAALLAGAAFAFGELVWGGAINANVQVLASACSVWALLASVVFARCGDYRALLAACACCGLGVATHPSSIWILPAIAVAVLWRRREIGFIKITVAVAAFALPLLLYAYLPLRSAFVAAHGLDPNTGPPLFGAGNFDWDANAPRTVKGFLDEVFARPQRASGALVRTFVPSFLVRAPLWWLDVAGAQYSLWLLLLAAAGTALLAWTDRRSLSVVTAALLGGVAFANVYHRDVHIDRYLFVSFAVVAALSAAASRPRLVPARVLVALILAFAAGAALMQNRPPPFGPRFPDGEGIINSVRQDTPDGAIIVAGWNDAAALGYGAYVQHALGSRLIVAAWPGQYGERFATWSTAHPVILYNSSPAFGGPAQIGGAAAPVHLVRRLGPAQGYGIYQVVP